MSETFDDDEFDKNGGSANPPPGYVYRNTFQQEKRMAVLKLATPGGGGLKAPGKPSSPSVAGLKLPSSKSVPAIEMESYNWMIYGEKKIGKTSLAVNFPGALLMSFEPGGKALEAFQVDIPDWDSFKKYLTLLAKGEHDFKTVVIDTAFEAYQRCLEYVGRKNGFDHPGGQNDFGRSWNQVKREFEVTMNEVRSAGMTLILLAHDTVETVETRAGQKFDKMRPNLPKQADEYFRARIDNVVHYHYRGDERFMTVRGSDFSMAGVASNQTFLTPNGEAIRAIPAGISPDECWTNLCNAWNNLQEESYNEETAQFEDEKVTASMRAHLAKAAKKR